MKIDIFDLTSKKIINQPVDLCLEIDKLYDGYEYINFSKPIILKGSFSMVEDIINLNAQLTTEFIIACSRCLEKFNYPIDIEIKEQFSRNKENEDADVILIESDKLDITDIIENNICLALPFTRLCKEDCKGLCQHCGTDLNNSTCSCNDLNVDLRLAKLKDLFSEN
jgi:uncharacterized protein